MDNGYFIAILIIDVLNLGIELARHGEIEEKEHNFFITLFSQVISLFIIYMAIKKGF